VIKIKVTGLDNAVKALQGASSERKRRVADEIRRSALRIQGDARRNAPVNMGRLRSDVQIAFDVSADNIDAKVYNTVEYAPFVEFGTKSHVDVPEELSVYAQQFRGKGGSFDDLLDSIERWAHLKGLPPKSAYPIARKIAREGRRAQPYLFPAVENERPNLERRLKEAMR
jgi:hypothetical protein